MLHGPYFSLYDFSLNYVKIYMQVNVYLHREVHFYLKYLNHKYTLCLWLVSICRTLIMGPHHRGGYERHLKKSCKYALDTLLTLVLKTQYLL